MTTSVVTSTVMSGNLTGGSGTGGSGAVELDDRPASHPTAISPHILPAFSADPTLIDPSLEQLQVSQPNSFFASIVSYGIINVTRNVVNEYSMIFPGGAHQNSKKSGYALIYTRKENINMSLGTVQLPCTALAKICQMGHFGHYL